MRVLHLVTLLLLLCWRPVEVFCEPIESQVLISLDATTDVSCPGMEDGSASLLLVGLGSFDIQLTQGGSEIDSRGGLVAGLVHFGDLAAGEYQINVELDPLLGPNEFDTLTFSIGSPAPIDIDADVTHVHCNNPDGGVVISVSGGTGLLSSLLDGVVATLQLDEFVELEVGLHTLSITDENGCTQEESFTIEEIPDPEVDVAASVSLGCLDLLDISATLTGGGGGNIINWSTDDGDIDNTNGLNATVSSPGLYLIDVVDVNGCSSQDQIEVTADIDLPTIGIAESMNMGCLDELTISADVESGISVSWQTLNGNILSGATSANLTVGAPGIYTAIALNTNTGCTNTAVIEITQDIELPEINLDATANLGCHSEITISSGVESGTTVNWLTLDGNILGNTLGSTIRVNEPGLYTATATNELGCISTSIIEVEVEVQLPTIDLGADINLGCRDQITLDANTGSGIQVDWLTDNGEILGSGQGEQISVLSAGIYTATATNELGCQSSDTLEVFAEVNVPQVSLGNDLTLSCGEDITLIADILNNLGVNLEWSLLDGTPITSQGGASITISDPGTYVATATEIVTGCVGSDTVLVTGVGGALGLDLGADLTIPCNGLLSLLADVNLDLDIGVEWSTPNGNIVGGNTGLEIQVDEPGIYVATATDLVLGCSISDTLRITLENPINLETTSDTTIGCQDTLIITSSSQSPGGLNLTFDWVTENGVILSGADQEAILVTEPGVYIVTAITDEGCSESDTILIQRSDSDVDLMNLETWDCGDEALEITTVITDEENVTYTWSSDNGNIVGPTDEPTIMVDQVGSYSVVVEDMNTGCQSYETVEVIGAPTWSVMAGEDLTIDCGSTLELEASVDGPAELNYFWTDGMTVLSESSTLNVTEPGTYIAFAQDFATGCHTTDTVEVGGDGNLSVSASPDQSIDCEETAMLSATVEGSDNYTVEWTTLNGNIVGNPNQLQIEINAPGSYFVEVTDPELGCSSTEQVIVSPGSSYPQVELSDDAIIDCSDTLQLTVSTLNEGNFTVTWTTNNGHILESGGGTNITITGPGTYFATVTDVNSGCEITDFVQILANNNCMPDTMGPEITDTVLTDCNEPFIFSPPTVDTSISYTVTQVKGLPSGSIFPVGTTEIVFIITYPSGDFEARCINVTVNPFEVLAEVIEPSCYGEGDGMITLQLPEDQEPLQLVWNDALKTKGAEVGNLTAGTYMVSGLTSDGCIINEMFHLCQPDSLMLMRGLTISETDTLKDGAVNVTVAGGTAPYLFEWYLDDELVSTEEDLYFIGAGSYTLSVTDVNGCTAVWDSIIVEREDPQETTGLYELTAQIDELVHQFNVFPNPSVDEVKLRVELEQSEVISGELIGPSGSILYQIPERDGKIYESIIDMRSYSAGIYVLQISVGQKKYTKRIILF